MAQAENLTAIGDKFPTTMSYMGAGFSIGSGLTLAEWGVVVGILTALLTFAGNMIYQHRRDQRDQQRHELLMEHIRRGGLLDSTQGKD